ncbi:MAG: glycosyltransferase [Pseudomonadota bacterium]
MRSKQDDEQVHAVTEKAFSPEYYLDRYPDVLASGIDPLEHYLNTGWCEGRDPAPAFSTSFYLQDNADVAESGINPFYHYLITGIDEGRRPVPLPAIYGDEQQYEFVRAIVAPAFDADFYARHYPGHRQQIRDPLEHFLLVGCLQGYDPTPNFSTSYYLQANPDVAAFGVNAFYHYLTQGRREGRRPSSRPGAGRLPQEAGHPATGYRTAELPAAPAAEEWHALADRIRQVGSSAAVPVVDVVIPVYKGYAETLNCIYQVLNAENSAAYELVVINDRSPDDKLVAKLRELAGSGLISYRENDENLGFVKTVNLGMALHEDRDVILLNADTEVYRDWIDRLRRAAYSVDRVATVTPFSNSAEICSYPYTVRDNDMQLELSYRELDRLAAEMNDAQYLRLPTGIGFCMYIRRECLREIGAFDAAEFGKGYGEENDFCLRAAENGWLNLMAADTFVRHLGGASFGAEKQERVLNAIRIINKKYPGYDRMIQDFLYEDPVRPFRKNIDIARLRRRAGNRIFLMIGHNWGGGTEKHMQDMAAQLQQEGVEVYTMRPDLHNSLVGNIHCPGAEHMPNLPLFDVLSGVEHNAAVLRDYGITHVHVHSLAGFDERILTALPEAMQRAGLDFDMTLHDYTAICPRIHLCDEQGRYCGEPDEETCRRCIEQHDSPFGQVDIRAWKRANHDLLQRARKVFVPSEDVRSRMHGHYPDLTYTLRMHPEPRPAMSLPMCARRKAGEMLKLGVIGAIGPHKGSNLLLACAQDALARRLPIEFVVIGYTNLSDLEGMPNVLVTGEYDDQDVYDLIHVYRVHAAFFPATWPETYSYTLSIAIRAGLRPLAFDIGAIAERMRTLGYDGLLMPFEASTSARAVNDFILDTAQTFAGLTGAVVDFMRYDSLVEDYYQLH